MQPKVLLVTNDPALRLRFQVGLDGSDVQVARDEYEARALIAKYRQEPSVGENSNVLGNNLTVPGEILPFAEYERIILQHALATTGWNVKQAAARLNIGRATLYRKIDRYELKKRFAG